MFTKWIIEGIDDHVIAEDGVLYKKPFMRNKKMYDWREIKKQTPNRYRINGRWWSERQLRPKLKLDPNPELIFKSKNLPF